MSAWAVILAGGSGTRFWPLSTRSHPKQFLSLVGERPLLTQAVDRLDGLVPPERVLVVTAAALVDRTRALLPGLPAENVYGEPRAASTAPALTWATWVARSRDPEAVVLSIHADWFVGDDGAFRVVPSRPEVGYGYIQLGDQLGESAHRVQRFVEKPDRETARALIDAGALWNSGLFAWTAQRFVVETEAVAPEVAPHVARLTDEDVSGFFDHVTPIAVDVSHFERSARVAVVRGTFPWDDVGTWAALARARPLDRSGNVVVGEAVVRDASECVVWADDGPIVVDGARGLVVVRANGVTLVTTHDRAADLKTLLEALPSHIRDPSS
jgi:mannose-1-phosphate guanylyltransferase